MLKKRDLRGGKQRLRAIHGYVPHSRLRSRCSSARRSSRKPQPKAKGRRMRAVRALHRRGGQHQRVGHSLACQQTVAGPRSPKNGDRRSSHIYQRHCRQPNQPCQTPAQRRQSVDTVGNTGSQPRQNARIRHFAQRHHAPPARQRSNHMVQYSLYRQVAASLCRAAHSRRLPPCKITQWAVHRCPVGPDRFRFIPDLSGSASADQPVFARKADKRLPFIRPINVSPTCCAISTPARR